MTKEQQLDFVMSITNELQDEMLKRVKHVPDNWDGLELRRWIGDYYVMHFQTVGSFTGKRKKDYNNEIIINPKLI